MPSLPVKAAEPSDDRRWRLVNATIRKHGNAPDALIETLHTTQEAFGYLDDQALHYAAAALHVPLSQVYGVVTFYHAFTLKPEGRHKCVVCLGTACYIKGSQDILDAVEGAYLVQPGNTTSDSNLSLLTARCLGSCSLAPAAVFDDEVVGKLTADDVLHKLEDWTNHDA